MRPPKLPGKQISACRFADRALSAPGERALRATTHSTIFNGAPSDTCTGRTLDETDRLDRTTRQVSHGQGGDERIICDGHLLPARAAPPWEANLVQERDVASVAP